MEKITLPTKSQIENLEILEKYGTIATATDFDMMQYGYIKIGGEYWTKTPYYEESEYVMNVGRTGTFVTSGADWLYIGVRPIISLQQISKSQQKINKKVVNGIEEIEYGEYPQNIVDESLKVKLERLYQNDELNKTNKKYTSMQRKEKEIYQEYLYKGKKYIRVKARIISKRYKFKNGQRAKLGEIYWVKVEPIKWLIDEEENIAISKEVLTNMPFSYNGDNRYEQSDVKEFLEKVFIKEIQVNKIRENKNVDIEKINDLIDLMASLSDNDDKKTKAKKL